MTRKSLPVWLSEEHHGPNHHILTYKTKRHLRNTEGQKKKTQNGRVKKKAHRTRGKEKGGQGGVSVAAPNAQLTTSVLTNCHQVIAGPRPNEK